MSTYYTSKYSGEQIDEAVRKILDGEMTGDYADRQLSNLDTPQGALANLGAGVRPNELDNPGLCVNQRGQDSYTGNGGEPVTFDRWQAGLHTIIAKNGGNIVVSASGGAGYILQRLENPIFGKAIVFSVLTTLGLYECKGVVNSGGSITQATPFGAISVTHGARMYALIQLNDGQSITLPVQDGDVAKLEIGDTQTLAYQDDTGAWQLLPQPESDYATQLLKCQRYLYSPYYRAATTTPIGAVFVSNSTTGFVQVDLPNQMRIKPVFFGEPYKLWIVKSNGGGAQRPSALSVMGMSGCAVFMSVTASFDTGGSYIMYTEDVSNPSDFLLSAEL